MLVHKLLTAAMVCCSIRRQTRWLFEALVIGDMIMLLCPSKEKGRSYHLANAMRQIFKMRQGTSVQSAGHTLIMY